MKSFQAEIISSVGALDAVEKCGNLNQLVPCVQKIKIQNLLFHHVKILILELEISKLKHPF
ncbi:MAG TPA: hypothetical protein VMH30_03145 [Verrucomicrobiae bacterium]|nr:hypothetical protein [Verrucomicrobiae bacterium]